MSLGCNYSLICLSILQCVTSHCPVSVVRRCLLLPRQGHGLDPPGRFLLQPQRSPRSLLPCCGRDSSPFRRRSDLVVLSWVCAAGGFALPAPGAPTTGAPALLRVEVSEPVQPAKGEQPEEASGGAGHNRGACKHLGIDPFVYLREALPGLFALGEKPTVEQLTQWLPDRWLLGRTRDALATSAAAGQQPGSSRRTTRLACLPADPSGSVG